MVQLPPKIRRWFAGLIATSAAMMLMVNLFIGNHGVHKTTTYHVPLFKETLPVSIKSEPKTATNFSRLKNDIQNTCAKIRHVRQINYKGKKTRQIFRSREFNFAVCVVPKSGCTFMKQLVYYLNDPRDWNVTLSGHQSRAELVRHVHAVQRVIFDTPRMNVHHDVNYSPLQLTLAEFAAEPGLRVVLARNPYSRLFSAYIDKIFVPVRWNVQVRAYRAKLQLARHSDPDLTDECQAKHETFEDFLETVVLLAENGLNDIHWAPISELCAPCRVHPDIVVRQESYQADAQYLLDQLGVTGERLDTIHKAMAKHGVQTDTYLHGLAKTMFTKGLETAGEKCFTKVEIAQRVFQALKIQGQLYQALQFPYEKFYKVGDFDADYVASVILGEMRSMPINAVESRLQRERALARAYRGVRPEVLIQIQGVYYHDFMTFGYDFAPPSVE